MVTLTSLDAGAEARKHKSLKELLDTGIISQPFYDFQKQAAKQIDSICDMKCKAGECSRSIAERNKGERDQEIPAERIPN